MTGNQEFQNMIRNLGSVPDMDLLNEWLSEKETDDDVHQMSDTELKKRLVRFFKDNSQTVIDDETGQSVVVWKTIPTKAKLCLYLGINQKTLQRYVTDDYFMTLQGTMHSKFTPEGVAMIRKTIGVIADFYESRLASNSPVGSIFWLKNLKDNSWQDDQTLRVTNENNAVQMALPQRTAEQIAARHMNAQLPDLPDFDE